MRDLNEKLASYLGKKQGEDDGGDAFEEFADAVGIAPGKRDSAYEALKAVILDCLMKYDEDDDRDKRRPGLVIALGKK